jgi:hypothetical protein
MSDFNSENLPVDVFVQLSLGETADTEELDEMARQLQSDISELNVDAVEPVSGGAAPQGTKSAEMVQAGQLLVTLAPTVIPPLFDLIKSWTARRPATPVKVKLKVGHKTADLEYDPATTTPAQLAALVKGLERSMNAK